MRKIEIHDSAWRSPGRATLHITLVETHRVFGGREEGGWYYDRRFVVKRFRGRRASALHRAKLLAAEYEYQQPQYDRYSVLGSFDLEILITKEMVFNDGSQSYS